MIYEGGSTLHDAAKKQIGMGKGMSEALEITLTVQLKELKLWDQPAY